MSRKVPVSDATRIAWHKVNKTYLKVEYQNTEIASILERLIYKAEDFHTIAELNILLK